MIKIPPFACHLIPVQLHTLENQDAEHVSMKVPESLRYADIKRIS